MTSMEMNNIIEKCKRLGFTGFTIEELIDAFIIYLRKSRSDEEVERYLKMTNPDISKEELDKEILKRHEDQIQVYAKETIGFKIPEKNIRREVKSGGELEEREVMKSIMLDIEDENILGVFVLDIDRIGRPDALDTGLLIQAFELTDTKIFVATPPKIWDLSNEFDKEYFEDSLRQARKFLNYTKTKMTNGRKQSVREGKFIGRFAPYGYNKVKLLDQKGYTLEQNEDAETVRMIFDMILYQGMGTTVIARVLNEKGIKPPEKNAWQPQMVRHLLKRKSYAGFVTYGEHTTIKQKRNGIVTKVKKKNEEALICKGLHKPIITIEELEQAQELMKQRASKNVPNSNELQNPLAGLIKCKCGYSMQRRKNTVKNLTETRESIDKNELAKYIASLKEQKNLTIQKLSDLTGINKATLSHYCGSNKRVNLPKVDNYKKLKEVLGMDNRFDELLSNGVEEVVKESIFCPNTVCHCSGTYIGLVEEEVLKQLRERLQEYNTFIDNYYQDEVVATKDFKKEIEKLENDIVGLQNQISTACDLLERKVYTDEMFLNRVNKLNADIDSKKKQIEELKSIDIKQEIVQHERAVPILEAALNNYHNFTPEEKNEFLYSFIEKIVYSKSTKRNKWSDESDMKLEITWKEL